MRLKKVTIRLSNDEQMSGDIISDPNGAFITLRGYNGTVLHIQRGAIVYITESA